ncbi:MAG: DUF5681 domain-containing protein [Tannerellaceae bacterium]
MGQRKGQTGNPNGKPKGATNKTTRQAREMIQKLFDDNIDQVQQDLDAMTPKDRVEAMIKLLPYLAPKLQSITLDDNREQTNSLLKALTDLSKKD